MFAPNAPGRRLRRDGSFCLCGHLFRCVDLGDARWAGWTHISSLRLGSVCEVRAAEWRGASSPSPPTSSEVAVAMSHSLRMQPCVTLPSGANVPAPFVPPFNEDCETAHFPLLRVVLAAPTCHYHSACGLKQSLMLEFVWCMCVCLLCYMSSVCVLSCPCCLSAMCFLFPYALSSVCPVSRVCPVPYSVLCVPFPCPLCVLFPYAMSSVSCAKHVCPVPLCHVLCVVLQAYMSCFLKPCPVCHMSGVYALLLPPCTIPCQAARFVLCSEVVSRAPASRLAGSLTGPSCSRWLCPEAGLAL